MNYYSVSVSKRRAGEFLWWLQENFGHRYRLIRATPSVTYTLIPRSRWMIHKRRFHSQVLCANGGWSKCHLAKGNFHNRPDHMPPDDRRVRVFNSRFEDRCDPMIIGIVFDSAADLVFCKMRWHGEPLWR